MCFNDVSDNDLDGDGNVDLVEFLDDEDDYDRIFSDDDEYDDDEDDYEDYDEDDYDDEDEDY